jgi:hypothetical protein
MDTLIELFDNICIDDVDVCMIQKTIKNENYADDDIKMLIDGIKMISIDDKLPTDKSKKRKIMIKSEHVQIILRLINECREKKSFQEINTFMPKWIDGF